MKKRSVFSWVRRDYPTVSETERDFAMILDLLENPTPKTLGLSRALVKQIREHPTAPQPDRVLAAVRRILEESSASRLETKIDKRPPIDPRKSPIHRQLKSLAAKKRKFNIIIADPAWEYKDEANAGERGAKHKYPVMRIQDIYEIPVQDIVADNAVLLLWGTWPLLPEALACMRAWGFKFKTCGFVWVKKNKKADSDFMGGGHYTRSNSEYVIIGVRGKRIPRKSNSVMQVLHEAVREHSRKPESFYDSVKELYDLRKYKCVELFGRTQRENITVLGNDTKAF